MFRVSQYMQYLHSGFPDQPQRQPTGPVVIWNLVRRCNLACKHCYSISADIDFPNELETAQVKSVMDDLRGFGVPVLILSGGEPLLRPDIFELSDYARHKGFYVALSTNGTLINDDNIGRIAAAQFDYVGISLDGIGETHDQFRGKIGAFDQSLHAVRLCKAHDVKVGIRFSITRDNAAELPLLLQLMDEENLDKFYLSHLNYGGRGNRHRGHDAIADMTRTALDQVFEQCWSDVVSGRQRDYVTGNNDADAIYLLKWAEQRFPAEVISSLRQRLVSWGGNASGIHVANIDNHGNVHPDTFWWDYNLGNVKERLFSEIWNDCSDPLMAGLKQKPRQLHGRCGVCPQRDVCGGNTRTRAFQTSGDPWWEDSGCYLSDQELGIDESDYLQQQPLPMQLATRKITFHGNR